jgi:uncharacterized protein YaaQ
MCENCDIDLLIVANISSEHVPLITKKLNQEQYYFTRIASNSSLLNLSTDTLIIGIQQDRYDSLKELLHKYCKKQRTHIATQTQMEAHFQPSQPIIIEAETGGATILTLPVIHFEQY